MSFLCSREERRKNVSKECGNGFKESLAEAYDLYAKYAGLVWDKPFFQRYDTPNPEMIVE